MKKILILILLNLLWLTSSCNVKETSPTSQGLIANHKPTENSFSLVSPTSSNLLKAPQKISLQLEFPFDVLVDTTNGTPYLKITVGEYFRQASYVSGHGTKFLTFEYMTTLNDDDSDGIEVNQLILNGGTLNFNYKGTIMACDTTLQPTVISEIKADNTAPVTKSLTLTNLPGFYHLGDYMTYLMEFEEPVYVTGTPRLQVNIGTGGPIYAAYAGGSGSKFISFSYQIANTHADLDGYTFTTPIDLNGGKITDQVGNNANLSFTSIIAAAEALTDGPDFDGRVPYTLSVNAPSSGVYTAGQTLQFSVLFNRAVTVTGTPYLSLTIGQSTKQANYHSGSGTSTLVFRYTVMPGDTDLDGISVTSILNQNGGDITGTVAPQNSFFIDSRNYTLTVPSTTGILTNATQPTPQSVTLGTDSTAPLWGSSPDNTWIIGQQILITVGFNTNMFVTQTSGTPRIPITIGPTQRYATYSSGGNGQTSLIFAYTVQEGDEDTDGSISIGNIELNGGTITDSATTNSQLTLPVNSLSNIKVDGVRPVINSMTPPTNGSYSQSSLGNFNFSIIWSEPVKYSTTNASGIYVAMDIGGSNVSAIYSSGDESGVTVHAPTTIANLNDSNGIQLTTPLSGTGNVKDKAGNTATNLAFSVNTSSILVDNTPPTVQSVTPPSAGSYKNGDDLNFIVQFSESVTIDTSGGAPHLKITIGNNVELAEVTSAGTGSSHTFRYTITANDSDPDDLSFDELTLTIPDPSYIKDAALNDITQLSFTDPNWTGTEIVPSVTSSVANPGTYVGGGQGPNVFNIKVNFNEGVTVAGGTPSLSLSLGTGTVSANYDSLASTSTQLSFDYAINPSNDMDLNGVSLALSSIQLNGATIQNADGKNADLALGNVSSLSQVFIAPHLKVWIKGSTVNRSGITQPSSATVSTNASVSNGYFDMNGSNGMTINNLGNVNFIGMAIRTPSAGDTFPQYLISNDNNGNQDFLQLDNNTIDISTTVSVTLKTKPDNYGGTNTTHPGAMTTDTLTQFEVNFSSGTNMPTNPFISSSFTGEIAEVLIFEGALSNGQKSHVGSYLDASY
jgi:hypothetical protein